MTYETRSETRKKVIYIEPLEGRSDCTSHRRQKSIGIPILLTHLHGGK